MTKQQAEQFINIYNALLTISTKGEDTKTMAKILALMEQLANTVEIKEEPIMASNTEPVVEGE